MLFIFGSVCAFLLSCLYYMKPNMNISLLFSKIYYNILFSAIGAQDFFYELVNRKHNKIVLPHLPQKVAIVTGGSRGIGASIVKMLLQCDMEVIIACRTPSAGEKLILEIRESGVTSGKPKVYELDNASFESVHKFADEIKQNYTRIHILINNAGLMFPPHEETKDGFELQWGINYLSHFLLTALLLPVLKADSNSEDYSRVVNVSSCVQLIGSINFDDINYKKGYNEYATYGQSKLAQVISTIKLQNLFEEKQLKIQMYAVHPGVVATDLILNSYLKPISGLIKPIFNLMLKTPEQGATSIVYAAVSEEINRGGIYISNCKEQPVNSLALDESIQDRLLQISLEQVKLKDFFQYLK